MHTIHSSSYTLPAWLKKYRVPILQQLQVRKQYLWIAHFIIETLGHLSRNSHTKLIQELRRLEVSNTPHSKNLDHQRNLQIPIHTRTLSASINRLANYLTINRTPIKQLICPTITRPFLPQRKSPEQPLSRVSFLHSICLIRELNDHSGSREEDSSYR